jgi:hypothetical protein
MEKTSFRSIDRRCDTNINEKFLVSGREDTIRCTEMSGRRCGFGNRFISSNVGRPQYLRRLYDHRNQWKH